MGIIALTQVKKPHHSVREDQTIAQSPRSGAGLSTKNIKTTPSKNHDGPTDSGPSLSPLFPRIFKSLFLRLPVACVILCLGHHGQEGVRLGFFSLTFLAPPELVPYNQPPALKLLSPKTIHTRNILHIYK